MERAALRTVDRAATRGKTSIRSGFSSAGLAGLGRAIGSNADKAVRPIGDDGFTASAQFFVRSRSERTRGAIEAYTEGATILPVRSRLLWFPTEEIRRVAGSRGNRQRVTPGNWAALGLDTKIGPLVTIQTKRGPIMVVPRVGVSGAGKKRSARSLTKSGRPRKGDVEAGIVAFIGIPRTIRLSRVNIRELLRAAQNELPAIFAREARKEGR